MSDALNGEAYNVGGNEHIAHRDLVKLLVELAGAGGYRFVEWPADKKAIDIGSFYADSSRFMNVSGWRPQVTLREGLARTIQYYKANLPHYLDAADATPA
jgi:nucleoside-diphosphate-sugar epimerase